MELQPEELLLAALLRRAIKDAKNGEEYLRVEASRWLWTVAPSVAERAGACGQPDLLGEISVAKRGNE